MSEELFCEKCERDVNSENDLLDYEDMRVCEYCFDELRRLDEQVYQGMSTEGFDDYE